MNTERTIRFTKAPGYRVLNATGVWGGIAPQGDLFIDLFVDRRDSPEEVILEVKNGQLHEKDRRGGEEIIRELQTGIFLRADVAYSIGKWLMEKATEAGHVPASTESHDTKENDNG
jgi:hypothetical protein